MAESHKIFEYDSFKIGAEINKEFFEENFIEKQKLFTYAKKGEYKAKQFVGVVRFNGISIEVHPKIYKNGTEEEEKIKSSNQNLLRMMEYAWKLKIKENEASLKEVTNDIFEVFVYLFAKNLFEILSAGISKNYVAVEDESRFLKGQWRINEQIATMPHLKHLFLVRYDEYTEDNTLNRILKYVTNMLSTYSKMTENKKILNEILLIYNEVYDLREVAESDINRVHFNRMNESYKDIFEFALLFIRRLSNEMSSGTKGVFSFMLNMNKLFESFIAEFIRREVKDNSDKLSNKAL